MAVTLDGGAGIAAGQYVLMPAHYALLPGAYRVVQNSGALAPTTGAVQTLRDGSIIMGGAYSTAGTGLASSQRVSFTIESQATFEKYSTIHLTDGTTTVQTAATSAGIATPSIPLDAARVVLDPLSKLNIAGVFDLSSSSSGRGSEVDILGSKIIVDASGTSTDSSYLAISNATLANLDANSLLIGGTRTENADDTTSLGITASRITLAGNAVITAPEVILAVGGANSALRVDSGAQILATGTLDDTRGGDFVIQSSSTVSPSGYDTSGIGSLIRVSTGAQRLVDRAGSVANTNANRGTSLTLGDATVSGNALTLDTSDKFSVSANAKLAVPNLALSGSDLAFGANGTIDASFEQQLASVANLTLASRYAITFDANTVHSFNNLALDTPGLGLTATTGGADALTIDAKALRIGNSSGKDLACGATGAGVCTTTGNILNLNASSVTFLSGNVHAYSFDGAIHIAGNNGAYVEGAGSLIAGGAALSLTTPFLIDRAAVIDLSGVTVTASDSITPAGNYTIPVTPNYTFATTGAVSLTAPTLAAGMSAPVAAGLRAPGATILFGSASAPVASLAIDGVAVTATAGVIGAQASGDIALTNGGSLATPGYARSYGDQQSTTTISAGGGTVNLVSTAGSITLDTGTAVSVDDGIGNAGTLDLLAADGGVTLGATLDKGVTGPRAASLTLDAGTTAFDLDSFVTTNGTLFEGTLQLRSGLGDLDLAAGHTLKALSVSFTADGGVIDIAGTIDTSGVDASKLTADQLATAHVDGGNIALWGMNGVTLEGGSLLDTHTSGYGATSLMQASAGNVTIGIGDNTTSAITIASGATIDLAATATQAALAAGLTGNRLVAKTVKDPNTLVNDTAYDFVAADTGGTLLLRAPVVGDNENLVNIALHGSVIGAGSKQIEGYATYNLDNIASNGLYDGVSTAGTGVSLDFTQTGNNILSDVIAGDPTAADGTQYGSIPYFIQNFAISASDGSNLDGYRLRPGIDLTSAGDITVATNWNLAAGSVDQAAAIQAGLMVAIPELGTHYVGGGYVPYYAVVAGQEGNLLENYTSFLYRVGGKASGEAPVVSFAAGGNLDIQGSISDGFFTFADKSDPNWINYQLGGGNRTFDPSLLANCGTALDCSTVASYADVAAGNVAASADNTLTINLTKYYTGLQEGSALVVAPYSDIANDPTADGNNSDPNTGNASGDPIGFAQLFPLLSDGSAMHSSSLRLTAGAGATVSVNPLHIDRATGANLTVEGETQYQLTATAGAINLGSALDLKLALSGFSTASDPVYALGSLIGTSDTTGNVNDLTGDSYTSVSWGSGTFGEPSDLRMAAESFFAHNSGVTFLTRGNTVTGVAAPLSQMLAFLQSVQSSFVNGISSQSVGYPSGTLTGPKLINFGSQVAYTHSLVRTGDGSIDVAAAGNVDLTNANTNLNNIGTAVVYRTSKGVDVSATNSAGAQVGGTAIYTAGVRVASTPLYATIAGTTTQLSVTPDSAYQAIATQDASFIPSPKGLDDQAGVVATGGGDVSISAGDSVLALRDLWSETFLNSGAAYSGGGTTTYDITQIGDAGQRWRVGSVGQDTEIAIAPKYFSSGVGALGGGNVAITAGGDVSELTVALDTSVVTNQAMTTSAAGGSSTPAGLALVTFGRGDLSETVGGNLLAGQVDVAHGVGSIAVDGSVLGYGTERTSTTTDTTGYLQVSLADASVQLSATGAIDLAGVSALAASDGSSGAQYNAAGFYAPEAAFSAIATGSLDYVDNRLDQTVPFQVSTGNSGIFGGSVLPPSLTLAALTDQLNARSQALMLYPSAQGNLNLFSAGNLSSLVIAMSDSDPSLLPGALSAANITLSSVTASGAGDVVANQGLGFGIPGVTPTTPDYLLRLYHYNNPNNPAHDPNQIALHAGDTNPIRIFAGGDISNAVVNVPKASEVIAGRDIVDLFFTGQNANTTDTTVIQAGRDILGTTGASSVFHLPYVVSSDFVLGGGGTLVVQAGRDLGPFINSATVGGVSYAGGIQTVGNTYNPWLDPAGANLTVLFGVGNGVNYTGLRDAYLDPANFAQLDGSLFVQVTDALGNRHPDRSEQIYAPILAEWLRSNAPNAFAAIFGSVSTYPDTTAGNTALAAVAYGQSAALYKAFTALDPLLQDSFLIHDLYFNELQQAAEPTSASYLQYFRGYWAIDTLFPSTWGYTDNMSVYTVNPSSITADHPQGVPTRKLVADQPEPATQVHTGNADMRLATLQTASGGDLTILGPGGDFIAGSVVRTSTQAAARVTRFGVGVTNDLAYGAIASTTTQKISAIPIGYEGVLTLNGGSISSFTDGSFLVNQSRVFTEAGGDVTMWSSNGDLNAGQGPRSASNFPPVTVRIGLDGESEVDSAGSVSGAGIGAFQRSPTDPLSSVILIAPAGLVDAGDAGVRASGDVLVAAARVANADAFSAGGAISGVPAHASTPTTAAPSSASTAAAAQAGAAAGQQDANQRPSIITVSVLGFVGTTSDCDDPNSTDGDCPTNGT